MNKEEKTATKRDFSNFNAFDVVLFAWEKKVPLLIVTVLAAVISIIVSYQITPLYESKVTVFAAPPVSVSKSLLSDNYSSRVGLLNFGEEEQAEQLLQVLNSGEIKSRIIEKYNLMEHYEIDAETKYPVTTLNNKFKKYITFKRTEYQSVVIRVLDRDPQFAADIANDIAALIDTAMIHIQRDRAMMALSLVESEYFALQNQIQTLEDSLSELRKLGVFEYESQAEVLNDAYAQAIMQGNNIGAQKLEEKLNILAQYGGAYVSIAAFLEYQKEELSDLKAKYVEAKVEAEQTLPQKFIVDSAFKAEKKAYPKKSIIVMASTASTFLFALVILLIIESLLARRKKQA
ncbi:MAG: hypothetical protein ACOC0C_03205 [Bacteroidota bacterium]